jgi:MFS family permease
MATAILPFFITSQLGYSAAIFGLIEGISDGSSSFVKPFAGYLSDRLGRRKPPIDLGYALTGILIPMIGVASNWVQVVALRAGGWMGRGIRGGPRDAMLADSVSPSFHGRAFGFHRAMDTIGATVGPSIALLLIPLIGYREIFYLTAVPGVAAIVIVLIFVKDAKRKSLKGDPPGKSGFITSISSVPRTFKLFLVGVGIFGISNFANTLFALRAYQLLEPVWGPLEASLIAVALYTFLNAIYAASSFPMGRLGDRYQKRKLLSLGYLVNAVATLGFAFAGADLLTLGILFAAVGLQIAIVDTIEAAYAAELLPETLRGTGYGSLHAINGLGDFASSSIVGALWSFFSPMTAFAYSSALSFVACIALLHFTAKAR